MTRPIHHEKDPTTSKSYTFACINDKKLRVILADNEEQAWDKLKMEVGEFCEKICCGKTCNTIAIWKLIQICIY